MLGNDKCKQTTSVENEWLLEMNLKNELNAHISDIDFLSHLDSVTVREFVHRLPAVMYGTKPTTICGVMQNIKACIYHSSFHP